jgi:hypothetical protein
MFDNVDKLPGTAALAQLHIKLRDDVLSRGADLPGNAV